MTGFAKRGILPESFGFWHDFRGEADLHADIISDVSFR